MAAALAVYFHKRFEETLLVAMTGMIFCVYVSGLFGYFIPGVVAAVLLCASACVYLVVQRVKDKSFVQRYVLTTGFIAALILLLFFIVSAISLL